MGMERSAESVFNINLRMVREGAFVTSWFIWFFTFPIQESMFAGVIGSLVIPFRLLSLTVIAICEVTRIGKYQRETWFLIALLGLLAVSALRADNTILLQGAMLVFCSRHYDGRHLLSTAATALLLSMTMVIVASVFGFIEPGDWIASDGRGLRRSFGFVYPSRLPNYYMAIVLVLMLTRKKINTIGLVTLAAGACLLLAMTGSRNPFLFTMVSLVLYPLVNSDRAIPWIRRNEIALCLLPAICIAGLLITTVAYDPNRLWMAFMDRMLSGRLHLSQTAIENNPITLFGSPLFGQITMANVKTGFFDSSIFRLAYFFGLIPAAMFVGALTWMLRRCSINGEPRLVFVAVIAILHGLVEGQLILLQYSPFLIGMIRPVEPCGGISGVEDGKVSSRLIVAQTPLQMLAAAAFLEKEPGGQRNDLLILDNYEGLCKQLPALDQISHLYVASQKKPYPNKPLFWLLAREIFFPTTGKEELEHACPGVCGAVEYDELVFSSATPLVHNLRKYVCSQDVGSQLIDDGMGSHIGSLYASVSFMDDIVNSEMQKLGLIHACKSAIKKTLRFLTDGRLAFGVKALWLFNPSDYERKRYSNEVKMHVLKMPVCQLSEDARTNMERCLKGYQGKRIVVLLGPDDKPAYVREAEGIILELLKEEDVVIRRHPRSEQFGNEISSDTYVDAGIEPWEILLAYHAIDGDTLLIGFFSTAQWMPKLLMDLEPSLLFLSELTNASDSSLEVGREMIEEIKKGYRDRKKVYLPSSMGDVERILDRFRRKRNTK